MAHACDKIRDRIFGGNGDVENAMLAFGIGNIEPHVFVVDAVTRSGTGPTMKPSVSLGRHEALFSRQNVVSRHAEDTGVIVRVNDCPLHDAKPFDCDGTLYSLHVSEVARDGRVNKVFYFVTNGNRAARVKADSEEIGAIGDVMTRDDSNVAWSAGMEAARRNDNETVGSDRSAEVSDTWKAILVSSNRSRSVA